MTGRLRRNQRWLRIVRNGQNRLFIEGITPLEENAFLIDSPLGAKITPTTRGEDAFTLLETLIAIVVFSIGLMAVSTISIATVKGNTLSRDNLNASVLAQNKMENLRTQSALLLGSLGPDGLLGTGLPNSADGADDSFPLDLQATNAAGDLSTAPSVMFANPDHAVDVNGNPVTLPLTVTLSPQIAWLVRNNVPGPGMKYITVVVGWKEGTINMYTVVSNSLVMH
jgi:prepilin-type N-terminal cleavage/methylation domain-containing protein